MIKERDDLQEKINKLHAFIDGAGVFQMLSEEKKGLLRQQYDAMQDYLFILKQRLKLEAQ